MRFAVLLVLLSACDLVFSLEFVDVVPHIPDEEPLEGAVTIPAGTQVNFDTTQLVAMGDFGISTFKFVRQDNTTTDVAVMLTGDLNVEGTFVITGDLPLIIVANAIRISGAIDASARGERAGPGGGRPGADDPGQGGPGGTDGVFDGGATGGGGGGFADGSGAGGPIINCEVPQNAPAGGPEVGEPALERLHGGGAGGRGGTKCPMAMTNGTGGGGGGAIQLSARESIQILDGGAVFAGGGGGRGGIGETACGDGDGGGGGGGAGGAVYLDAPAITNTNGTIAANGGGGGGGGRGREMMGSGLDGLPGRDALDPMMPSAGGASTEKGTFGGNGAILDAAGAGASGQCSDGGLKSFNTGGGGGAVGRIVFRTNVKVDPIGNVNPAPFELTNRASEVP